MDRAVLRTAPSQGPDASCEFRAGAPSHLALGPVFCQSDGPLLCADREEGLPLVRRQPARSGRSFLGLPRKVPDSSRSSPILPAAVRGGSSRGVSSGPGSRRRAGVYPCGGRTRRRRASSWRTHTTSTATGQPWNVARLHPTSGEERGRISGHAESPGLAVQRAASFAFGGRRQPQRPDAVMGRMSRRWMPVGGCATRDDGQLLIPLRKPHLT